jgi:hypothetical protein
MKLLKAVGDIRDGYLIFGFATFTIFLRGLEAGSVY